MSLKSGRKIAIIHNCRLCLYAGAAMVPTPILSEV